MGRNFGTLRPAMSLSSQANSPFPLTRWSLAIRLHSADPVEARRAVQDLFTAYRYPLYGYLRGSHLSHEDAEDVLQGFFAKMLRTDSLGDADPARGKLRTFLLTSLTRYKSNWQRDERRRQRQVRTETDLWDEEESRWQREQRATPETPELFFDRRWAAELIAQARTHLRAQYAVRGKLELHDALAPLLGSEESQTEASADISTRLGMTGNALRAALCRMRRDFRALLLQEVTHTLDEGEDPRREIRHLLTLFERG